MPSLKYALVAAVFACLIVAPTSAAASSSVFLDIQVTGTPTQDYYTAAIGPSFFPNLPNQSIQFSTGLVTSADGQFTATTDSQNDWENKQPVFNDFPSLLMALAQPWSITLDKGLPTQRNYTMSLNLGALPTTPVAPPVLLFPLAGSIISPLTTTFTFTPPAIQQPIYTALEHLPNNATTGSYVFDDQLYLPAGSTQWSPPAPLLPSTDYYFDLYVQNVFPQGLGFSDPVDEQNNPIPNWFSNGNLMLESDAFFTTAVPEPASISLLAAGAVLLSRRRR